MKLLLTFDLEEFVAGEFGLKIDKNKLFEISKNGFIEILRLLKKHKVKATLFTTLEFAEYCPELIEEAIKDGNELGLHALKHEHRYNKMSEERAYTYLKKAKTKLEKRFKKKIVSFRAPQMSRPSYEVLKKLGIKYDSSYHPTYIPGKYNLFFKTRKMHKKNGITVVPVSVTPLLRLPFSWIWFRNLPLIYSKFCALTNRSYVNLYFHPWEFVNVSNYSMPSLIVRKTGKYLVNKLDKFIEWCLKKGYKPDRINEA